jgi:hypothetical protein
MGKMLEMCLTPEEPFVSSIDRQIANASGGLKVFLRSDRLRDFAHGAVHTGTILNNTEGLVIVPPGVTYAPIRNLDIRVQRWFVAVFADNAEQMLCLLLSDGHEDDDDILYRVYWLSGEGGRKLDPELGILVECRLRQLVQIMVHRNLNGCA